MFSEVPHVFEFSDLEAEAEPDEDELGFAVKAALCRRAGKSHEWCMNDEFATALVEEQYVLDALCDVAFRTLTDDRSLKRLEQPELWRGADKTAVGLRVLKAIDSELSEKLVELGISIGTDSAIRPVAAFSLPRRVMKAEDAIELWRLPEPLVAAQTPRGGRDEELI